MTTLFLIWRQSGRRWWPIGRLTRDDDGTYVFSYTQGAITARNEGGFAPLLSFPYFEKTYRSTEIFPLFANRLLSENRSEYQAFMTALDLPKSDWSDPLSVLGRTGGRRMTDTFEIFPLPERTPRGDYSVKFFMHGLAHQASESEALITGLRDGHELELEDESENPADPNAFRIVAGADRRRLGYVPRYFCDDFRALRASGVSLALRVERVNPVDTPRQFRLLCRLDAPWPENFSGCAGPDFAALAESAP